MTRIFSLAWGGAPFQMFGAVHLVTLGLIILLNLLLARLKHASESARRNARVAIAVVLVANEVAFHIWNALVGTWTIQTMLPFHLCAVMVWASAVMLLKRDHRIYEFAYFLGIAGALQALLTPDIGIYGFPHYKYFQTFISHGLIVTAAVYMTAAEGFRPTWKSLLRVAVGANLYMLAIFFLNQAIDSNYLFIAHKPETASLLDILPTWPIYILYIELIGVALCLLLYLPYVIKDWRTKTAREGSL